MLRNRFAVAREAWLHSVCENAITNFGAGREAKRKKKERKKKKKKRKRKERKGKKRGARLTGRNFKLRRCNVPLIVI